MSLHEFLVMTMFTIDELRQWPGSCGGCWRRVGCGWRTGCNKMLKLNSTTLNSSLEGQMESKQSRDAWSHWKLYVHSPNVTFTKALALRSSWGTITDDFRLMSFSVHWDSLPLQAPLVWSVTVTAQLPCFWLSSHPSASFSRHGFLVHCTARPSCSIFVISSSYESGSQAGFLGLFQGERMQLLSDIWVEYVVIFLFILVPTGSWIAQQADARPSLWQLSCLFVIHVHAEKNPTSTKGLWESFVAWDGGILRNPRCKLNFLSQKNILIAEFCGKYDIANLGGGFKYFFSPDSHFD